MKSINSKSLFLILLGLWFIVDLIQISTTGIKHDEAYYYVWGQYLDWGYFDHPPMVAVLTFLGDLFFEGMWAVRLFSAVLHALMLWIIWQTIESQYKQTTAQVLYFFGLAFSLPMFSAYGFITTPDTVLLFFFAWFSYKLKHFLERRKTSDIIWLAIATVGMIYSKYHAILVLFLVMVIHWRLIKQKRFWLLFFMVALLVLPHFIWLYNNDFISFKYHLIERSHGFNIKYFLEFIPGQFGALNPFFLGLFLILIFRKKENNTFLNTMRFIGVGVLLFFTLMTLKGRVEAHWTTIVSIPIIFVVFPFVLKLSKSKKYIKFVTTGLVGLILVARVLIAFDKLPAQHFDESEIAHYQTMKEFVNNRPVIFRGSFQEPAIYYFANSAPKLANKPFYRKRHTQFELWAWQTQHLGQKAFISVRTSNHNAPEHQYKGETYKGWFVDYYQDSRYIKIKYNLQNKILHKGKTYKVEFEISNTSDTDFYFNDKQMPLHLHAVFIGDDPVKAESRRLKLPQLKVLKAGEEKVFNASFEVPKSLDVQTYNLTLSIFSKLGFTTNSKDTLVKIED